RRFLIEVAPGDLPNKLPTPKIKSERIPASAKLANVCAELAAVETARRDAVPPSPRLDELTAQLKAVNEQLWDIEDAIRLCERDHDFGPRFTELARSVYRTNDRRSALKRAINDLLGARFVEEKAHPAYADNMEG